VVGCTGDWVGEPHYLGEGDRAVHGGQVAQHAAGADRGELLVVPISRTDPPRSMTYEMAAARSMVPAIPASSITTRVSGPIRPIRSGGSDPSVPLVRC
jgi:hypothetical protein